MILPALLPDLSVRQWYVAIRKDKASAVNKPASNPSDRARRFNRAKPARRSGTAPADIMAHRLFPALCAVWFAALFGLGCLAAGTDALGMLVQHLHLAAIVPAAAPPLGMTAHLVLGLMLAALGGGLGLVLGVALRARATGTPLRRPRAPAEPAADPGDASAPRVRSRDAHPDAPPRRPLVVTEDVLPYPTAVGDPVPASVPAPVIVPPVFEPVGYLEDLPGGDADHDVADGDHTAGNHAQDDHAQDDHAAALESPFLAAAYDAASRGEAPVVASPVTPVIVPENAAVPEPVAATPPLASLAAAAPQVPLQSAPLGSLGLVQLIERLALAIATRQARRATAEVAPAPAEATDHLAPLHRFDPLTMDHKGPLLRAKPSKLADFGGGHTAQAAPHDTFAPVRAPLPHDPLADLTDWSHDDHDHVPVEAHGLTAGAVLDHDDAADAAHPDDADCEDRYSSLARMTLRRPELMPSDLIAPGDPLPHGGHGETGVPGDPVVRFPQRPSVETGAAQAPDDADRALRDALATLRKISAQR